MKSKNIFLSVILGCFISGSLFANINGNYSSSSEGVQFRSANLTAAGLTCAMCTKAINTELERLSFVESVKVDIKTSSFNIIFKKESNPDFDMLKKAVEDAGFSVAKLKIAAEFENIPVQKDAHISIGNKTFHFLNTSVSNLKGERVFTVVDKDYLTAKEFKKYTSTSHMECVKTGKAGACCTKEGISAESRIYHVTI
jgi:copper chaperone CopZ